METSKIKEEIKTGNISSYYIFTGNELKVQDIYIEKLANKKPIQRVDSFLEIAKRLSTNSLLSIPKCYVIRDDKEILNEEAIWGNLEALIGQNLVIWVYTTIDKRSKFYKHFKGLICDFEHLTSEVLVKYVKKEIDLTNDNAKKLIDICENDYGRILLEIDKIKRYIWEIENTQEGKSRFDLAFEQLVKDGTIYIPPRDAIFMWVEAMLKKQKKLAYGLLQECKEIGESTLALISVLYNNTKQVLQVQNCKEKGLEIVNTTGLSSYQVKCTLNKCGYYSIHKLIEIMNIIEKTEVDIKMGNIPEELAIDYIMLKLFT